MREADFRKPTRNLLAKRVGYRCSNPNCRLLTVGPGDEPDGTVDVGVGAHITAAEAGGPRFDSSLTKEQRRSYENGIWLCSVHAKMIDDADRRFTVEVLREWKRISEEAARVEVENLDRDVPRRLASDIEALKLYAVAFDRPAFKDRFSVEMSMSAFDKAVRDTIVALSTGCLRDSSGKELRRIGRAELANRRWRAVLGTILDELSALVRRFDTAVDAGDIEIHNRGATTETYVINNPTVASWMDATRSDVLKMMNDVLAEAGLDPLPPAKFRHWQR